MLYRVFPWVPEVAPTAAGGPLFVPRRLQGVGRHDNPDLYGALYFATSAESAIAERLQPFRGQELSGGDLRRADGRRFAVAAVDESGLAGLVDLDEPRELARRGLRPSAVATRRRSLTQLIARAGFTDGASGLRWWSTLEASWINVTVFAERAVGRLGVEAAPRPLTVDMPEVRAAAELLGIRLVS